jgi:hypothetical protein
VPPVEGLKVELQVSRMWMSREKRSGDLLGGEEEERIQGENGGAVSVEADVGERVRRPIIQVWEMT